MQFSQEKKNCLQHIMLIKHLAKVKGTIKKKQLLYNYNEQYQNKAIWKFTEYIIIQLKKN